jgi:hypothetical protein
MISKRDKGGRQASCDDPVHAMWGRNDRGQCKRCQEVAKQRYESRNFIGRYLVKRAQSQAIRWPDEYSPLPATMAAYRERRG